MIVPVQRLVLSFGITLMYYIDEIIDVEREYPLNAVFVSKYLGTEKETGTNFIKIGQ